MKRIYLAAMAAMFLAACGGNNDLIVGSWIQPVPGMPGAVQGIQLEKDGKAASINMATLVYTSWERAEKDSLILMGQSIGNGQTIDFSEVMTIKKLSPEQLLLSAEDGTEMTYSRQK